MASTGRWVGAAARRVVAHAPLTAAATFVAKQDQYVSGAGGTDMLAWPELKPTTKFGQMPVLRFADGKELAQSTAIARYLARISTDPECKALYPVDDAYAAFQVDQYMMAVDDVRAKLVPTFAISDQAAKEAARAALFAEDGAMFLGFKKISLSLETDDGYMIGGKLSLADLALFVAVNQCRAGQNSNVRRLDQLD